MHFEDRALYNRGTNFEAHTFRGVGQSVKTVKMMYLENLALYGSSVTLTYMYERTLNVIDDALHIIIHARVLGVHTLVSGFVTSCKIIRMYYYFLSVQQVLKETEEGFEGELKILRVS